MIVGEHYQEYISWSIDIAMRIQNLWEELNIQSLWKLKENLAIIWANDWQRMMSLEMMLNTLLGMWYKPKSNWSPMVETQPTLE